MSGRGARDGPRRSGTGGRRPRADASAQLSPGAARRLGVALLLSLAAFAVLSVAVGAGLTARADSLVSSRALTARDPSALAVADVFTLTGMWWLTVPAVATGAVALWLVRRWRDAVFLLLSVLAAEALSAVLKPVLRRDPPLFGARPADVRFSYPSGHVVTAAALATALVLIAWPTRWRTPVLVAAAVYAGSMALAGVVTIGHWASDTLASLVLGVCVALALRLLTAERSRDGERDAGPGARGTARAATPAGPIEVVFLDWGGTLMVDDGTQYGPMAAWPQVEAVEGAREALEELRPHHRLLVATNADDSGARDVRAALYRVGLDTFVDDVVSSRDVGTRKPDPFFFRAALLRAGRGGLPLPAAHAVMVGDSWVNDVVGAHAAGLRAVWFNPARAARPAGAAPPDAEVARLADLPAVIAALQRGAPSGGLRRAGAGRPRGEPDADPTHGG